MTADDDGVIESEPVTVEVTGTTLRGVDIAGNTVAFDLTGWDGLETLHEFDEPIDAAAAGRVSEIRYNLGNVLGVDRLDGDLSALEPAGRVSDASYRLSSADDVRLTVPDGEYFCRIDASMLVRLRFDGSATIETGDEGPCTISFAHPTPVTFGFTSVVDYPRHELTVERSTDGIATALSHFPSSIETTSADRVHRNYRGYPPTIEFGSETHVPKSVRDATPETGIELAVPDRPAPLLVAAPLAYYLSARVSVGDVRTPVLSTSDGAVRREFASGPRFGTEAVDLLRRVFFFDLLVSLDEEDASTIDEYHELLEVGVDLGIPADRPIADRLATYLEAPTDPVDEILPRWSYQVTVEPTLEHASVLPHLLYDMAAVDVPAEATENTKSTPVRTEQTSPTARALSEGGRIRGAIGDVPNPEGPAGFVAIPRAYDHRLTDLERANDERTVAVVVADDAVTDRERARIVDRYECRSETVSPVVSQVDDPTREEFAALLEEGVDFLHYVGDCDGAGLACRDGHLSPANVADVGVRLFHLDAPNSTAVARTMVERGAIAGLARRDGPREGSVSTTVGELVLYGHCLASARACATVEGADHNETTILGDGTHRFAPKWYPSHVQSVRAGPDGLDVSVYSFPVDPVGYHWIPNWPVGKRLLPATIEYDVEPADVTEYVSSATDPIYHDGRLYWMDERTQLLYPVS